MTRPTIGTDTSPAPGPKNEGYTNFALCLLAAPWEERGRLHAILYSSILAAGYAFVYGSEQIAVNGRASAAECNSDVPSDYDPEDEDHLAVAFGAQAVGVRPRSVIECLRIAHSAETLLQNFERRHGGDFRVRVRTDIVLSALRGEISWRDFAVFSGVRASLGRDHCRRITRHVLSHLCLGFKSRAVMLLENPPASLILSERQIGISLDRLRQRGLIRTLRASRRRTFFTVSLDHDELHREVLKRERVRTSKFKTAQQLRDEVMMQAVQKQKSDCQ